MTFSDIGPCGPNEEWMRLVNAFFNGVQLIMLTWLTHRAHVRDKKENNHHPEQRRGG